MTKPHRAAAVLDLATGLMIYVGSVELANLETNKVPANDT